MKRTMTIAALLVMMCGECMAGPQELPPGPVKAVLGSGKSIAKVDYDGLPLEEVIKSLQKEEPSFQAEVRSAGDSEQISTVTLHLRDVTIDQLMEVLSKKYDWGIERVERSNESPIYVISVRGPKDQPWRVTSYCVTPIVDELVARKVNGTTHSAEDMQKFRKAALADVVATVETAVKMASDGGAAMIEVHEPTEMVIIRTGSNQREAAEDVLKAMTPAGASVVKGPTGVDDAVRMLMGGAPQNVLPNFPALPQVGASPYQRSFVDVNEAADAVRARLQDRRLQEERQEKEQMERQIEQLQHEIGKLRKMPGGASSQPAAPANN